MRFWVAEIFEQCNSIERHLKQPYILTKKEVYDIFSRNRNSIKSKKIVGIIGVCDLTKVRLNNNSVNINMLYVHNSYAGKEIEDQLLRFIISYATKFRCRSINMQLPRYNSKILTICFRYGFNWHTYGIYIPFLGYISMYKLILEL